MTHIVLIFGLSWVQSLWNVAKFEEGVGVYMLGEGGLEEKGTSFLLLRIFNCSPATQENEMAI